jgi:hypothetical protein
VANISGTRCTAPNKHCIAAAGISRRVLGIRGTDAGADDRTRSGSNTGAAATSDDGTKRRPETKRQEECRRWSGMV